MKKFLLVMLSVSLLIACGGSDENGSQENPGEENPGEENPGEGTPTWSEFDRESGWTQMTGGDESSDVGPWIEEGDELLPASCDGTLDAAADSAGLAWARNADSDASNVGANSTTNDPPPSVEDRLSPRPDLDDLPTPIFRTSFDGRMREYSENDDYERLVEIYDRSSMDNRININICATVLERGGCYVPGDELHGAGCTASPNVNLGTVNNASGFEEDGSDWTLSYRHGYECDSGNEVDDSHPEPDIDGTYFGDHILTLHDPDELPHGEVVELEAGDFEWGVSYRADRSCQDLLNPGPQCTCTWAFREVTDTERAWAFIDDGEVAIELKGDGDDDEFFLWGQFEIQ